MSNDDNNKNRHLIREDYVQNLEQNNKTIEANLFDKFENAKGSFGKKNLYDTLFSQYIKDSGLHQYFNRSAEGRKGEIERSRYSEQEAALLGIDGVAANNAIYQKTMTKTHLDELGNSKSPRETKEKQALERSLFEYQSERFNYEHKLSDHKARPDERLAADFLSYVNKSMLVEGSRTSMAVFEAFRHVPLQQGVKSEFNLIKEQTNAHMQNKATMNKEKNIIEGYGLKNIKHPSVAASKSMQEQKQPFSVAPHSVNKSQSLAKRESMSAQLPKNIKRKAELEAYMNGAQESTSSDKKRSTKQKMRVGLDVMQAIDTYASLFNGGAQEAVGALATNIPQKNMEQELPKKLDHIKGKGRGEDNQLSM